MTFVATVNAVAYTGARTVFADIVSPLEPWLSAAAVQAASSERTKAVMTMSYGGHAGETAELTELCAERGLMLFEDAAHAVGCRDFMAGTSGRSGRPERSASSRTRTSRSARAAPS